ncbi:MAG TPA: sigma-70 family RNA polymerase sigma factor [Saprospiraceae bacterium]|nr:sigma-70 family RNA polymerase sigma factor [Saprospiraceae bacterium]
MRVGFKNDAAIVRAIKSGGSQRQRAIRFLYQVNQETLKKVVAYVRSNSGNEQDGQDMFHEGIIVLDRNVRAGKFRGESSLAGYLYSICRFLWMNQVRKHSRTDLREDNSTMDQTETENPESLSLEEEKKKVLANVLTQLGDRCKKILELWKLSYSMQEIADQLDFSSAAMATKNKYKCHKKLMNYLKAHPQVMNLLR